MSLDNKQLISIINQANAMEYSFGPEIVTDPYHITVIRIALNRNLAACYSNIQEEVVQSFTDVLALDGDGKPRIIRLHHPHLLLRYVQDGRLCQP